ncbi:DNA-packaging protein [Bosea sp. (in: a-proteobacteria)]|uniref:DNA-packaging protein n=1 Tax=Bosea sp. (in: a-proteobacteria) TaxID=1871050 RepID=UPI002733A25E|nr:terminase family protein [Bosea sp. (in: a-proteobacteria)]MDP3410244.1 terminase family protein [Bosea sp. (in: a-proteobacteria)]
MRLPIESWARLIPQIVPDLDADSVVALSECWTLFGRLDQKLGEPPHKSVWLVLGGRGAGKTRTGAEWVKGMALGQEPYAQAATQRIALVGETQGQVRDVMIEGVSGLLAIHTRWERPSWYPSRRRLEWPNGAIAQVFSAEDPEGLRGPQFGAAWSDELAKWPNLQETWDMLQFGLRLGDRPRQIITTTPRPVPLIKRLLDDPQVAVSRAATSANRFNLAADFIRSVTQSYGGTRLGRQELDGELVEESADALWTRAMIEDCREREAPALARIVVAVDPPASSSARADSCGLVVAGLDRDGLGHVLEDGTVSGARPHEWAAKAVALYRRFEADALVVEVNQGGEMATAVIREVDPGVPVSAVRATRGKYLRAEPVAALYAQGRVRHAGTFPALEDEMCDFGPGGLSSGRSPDRLDALVWALTHLMLGPRGRPRVRGI